MNAEAAGRRIRRQLRLQGRVDVLKTAEQLGLSVDWRVFRGGRVQEITVGDRIAVDPRLPGSHRRWAIAHGIGHAVLHRDSPNHVWLQLQGELPHRFELEAEHFALHLLVDDSLSAGFYDRSEVAVYFGVPIGKGVEVSLVRRVHMRIIIIGTAIWCVVGLCAILSTAYVAAGILLADSVDELTAIYVTAMPLGFLPWLIGYAATRVLYGIEAAQDN